MENKIKFRAWDKSLRKFVTFYPFMLEDNNGLYVIQQFTGLKDKNGKEIYEGDVLNVSRIILDMNTGKVLRIDSETGVVFWSNVEFGYLVSFEHLRYDDVENLRSISNNYEVVGFKNPEPV